MTAEQLKSLCDTLKDFLTGSEIDRLLMASKISNQGTLTQVINGGLAYKFGTSKSDKLFNSFANELNTTKNLEKIMNFIERSANPISFVDNKEGQQTFIESLNKVLIFIGKSIDNTGRIGNTVKATTLDEADRRLDTIKTQFLSRKMHSQVEKYCSKEMLRKDYFDMVFEAAKGLFQRIREMTGLTTDGRKLAQTAFSKENPFLALNTLRTETEQNEQVGLQMLCESIVAMLRNPRAHTPKINWHEDPNKAMDALTIISFAHKYLDDCIVVPKQR